MVKAEYINYETFDHGRIARITLNRPRARNAQNRGLLVELDEAFVRAQADDDVLLARDGVDLQANGHFRHVDSIY